MSENEQEIGPHTQVSHEQDGRVLSGVGVSIDRLAETMERHTPPEEKKPVGTDASASAPESGAPPPAAPVSRGRQRFADLTRERDEARGETTKEREARQAAEKERDELKAKLSSPPPVAQPAQPKSEPAPAAAKPARFPSFEKWIALEANKDVRPEDAFDAWLDARDTHTWEQRRSAEEATARAASEQRAVDEHYNAYRAKHAEFIKTHPDFDAVVGANSQVSLVMARAALEGGPELAYYLATHADERNALDTDTRMVGPNDAAFPSVVATTKRYLMALIAAEQKAAEKPKTTPFTPPPAPHPTVGASTPTTAKSSGDYAKEGDVDAYRARRAAERGVKPRY